MRSARVNVEHSYSYAIHDEESIKDGNISNMDIVPDGPKTDGDRLDGGSVENVRGPTECITISDSEDYIPSTNNIPDESQKHEKDMITITANDGSLGMGYQNRSNLIVQQKPPVSLTQEYDDHVEMLEDESNSTQVFPYWQEDRAYNQLDSYLSSDIVSKNKGGSHWTSNDNDALLISDKKISSIASSITKNLVKGRRGNVNLNHSSLPAKCRTTITHNPLAIPVKVKEIEVIEIEENDPLAGCDDGFCDDEDNQTARAVNDTKSLLEPGKEPIIIDTNAILSGNGPLPMHNKSLTPPQFFNSVSPPPVSQSMSILNQSPRSILKNNANVLVDIPHDAFIVETPSFIVPYVFVSGEQSLKKGIKDIADKVKEEREAKLDNGGQLTASDVIQEEPKKSTSEDYFENPIGKLLMNIGMNMVQEYVQIDLLNIQKSQGEKEKLKSRMGMMTHQTQQNIISLEKNIEKSKENNEPFRSKIRTCELCSFKTESSQVMSTHQETPHMKKYTYRCNFCTFTTRNPQEIIFHMEAEHNVKGHLERAPAYHQCPNCPYENNLKTRLTRHLISCTKRFPIDKNLEPPFDWDTPAKLLPKSPKNRKRPLSQSWKIDFLPLLQASKNREIIPEQIRATNLRRTQSPIIMHHNIQGEKSMGGAGGIPEQIQKSPVHYGSINLQPRSSNRIRGIEAAGLNLYVQPSQPTTSNGSLQKNAPKSIRGNINSANQFSIIITPLPRQGGESGPSTLKKSQPKPPDKISFVICEICDGYIHDLDQLRNHIQWVHKVSIHPKLIHKQPPLNCQKCPFRFFTDQGLERHLLGSHGLVTSSMQDAANRKKDSGRCPLCRKVYQWKLLAHMAEDHKIALMPARLSYKCTVCASSFSMYKLFESHVYSVHSKNPHQKQQSTRSSPQ